MEEGDCSIYYPSKIYQKPGMEQKGQPIGNGHQNDSHLNQSGKRQFLHRIFLLFCAAFCPSAFYHYTIHPHIPQETSRISYVNESSVYFALTSCYAFTTKKGAFLMDAKAFGAFLAQTRKGRGLTQSELAEQLHVTDKAVSRWERGLGFPDINTLEPLAEALGLTLSQLMHADRGDGQPPEQSLEDFFTMFSPVRIQWQSVPSALFWLTVAVAVVAQFTLPASVTVQWTLQDNGILLPTRILSKPLVYLSCIGFSALYTQIWKHAECGFLLSKVWFPWWRVSHPNLAPWLELALHLAFAWLSLAPLFAETMILLFN